MDDLRVTLIQSDIAWEEPMINLELYSSKIDSLPESSDLIVLPEMFNTGFSMNPEKCAEPMNGPAVGFLRETSKKKGGMVMGSFLSRENDSFYNRLAIVSPDGSVLKYDKRHLFRLSEEFKLMSRGQSRTIVTWKGWKILPLVCFDLRFPVWSRNGWKNGIFDYDILIYVANWPKSRRHIWKSLLLARAIENQCYVVGVNRIGKDGFGTQHSGDSMIINPDGTILDSAGEDRPAILHTTLSNGNLLEVRESYPFAPEWDHFEIQP